LNFRRGKETDRIGLEGTMGEEEGTTQKDKVGKRRSNRDHFL